MAQKVGLIRRIDASGVPLLLARLFVGGMFAYLAVMKLRDPIEFLKQIHAYHILPTEPPQLVNTIAAVLPWLELVCAMALVAGIGLRGAGLLVTGLLLFFAPLLLWRAWGLYAAGSFATFCAVKFDCGCGTGEVFICRKMAENLALQVAALVPLFSASRRFCLSALLARSSYSRAKRAS